MEVYYTPFIRVEKGALRKRDLRDIEPETNTVADLIPQILPGSADEFRLLTDAVGEKGYRQIDINLGCPFPMIAGKHKGAGMLLYPAQVAEVLAPIAEYPEIQFSLKMRLGWENASECMVLVELLNTLRLSRIALHARTGKQQYKGHPDLEAFQGFYELCQHPLYYNGDIESFVGYPTNSDSVSSAEGRFYRSWIVVFCLCWLRNLKEMKLFCPNNVCQYILPSMKSFFQPIPRYFKEKLNCW